jgi:hypothetical protein
VRTSRLWTLLLSGPAPPDAVAVWFGDLPLDAPLECCYGPSNHPRVMGVWFSQAGGRREVTDHCWPGASRPMHGDLAGNGLGLAGERVHGGRAAQARLCRLLGPARRSLGGVGGHVWSARGRAPRHLVSRPPRRPWRVALTPDGRIQRPPGPSVAFF